MTDTSNRIDHWEQAYEKEPREQSWFQERPTISLELIEILDLPTDAPIIDVGGGTSLLVLELLTRGHSDLTVLDLSVNALQVTQARLAALAEHRAATAAAAARTGPCGACGGCGDDGQAGEAEPPDACGSDRVDTDTDDDTGADDGIDIDLLAVDLLDWRPSRRYRLWHDRAVLHFLHDDERRHYRDLLDDALTDDGTVVIGTFAPDGPDRCSGLPVRRHDVDDLSALLGPDFVIVETRREEHVTPWDSIQPFTWIAARRS